MAEEQTSTNSVPGQNQSLAYSENGSFGGRALSVAAGFLFVLSVTLVSTFVGASASPTPLFEQFVRPFTVAAAGLGTGHYLGKAIRNNNSVRTDLAVGFFLAIFFEAVYFTHQSTVQAIPYPAVSVVPALFALVIHLSPVLPQDDEIGSILKIFAGPVTTTFLVIATIFEFVLSYSTGLMGIIKNGLIVLGIFAIVTLSMVVLVELGILGE